MIITAKNKKRKLLAHDRIGRFFYALFACVISSFRDNSSKMLKRKNS
jgi:hypothetical protein